MKPRFCVILLLLASRGYGAQQAHIEAQSSGTCSPNIVSNQGKVTFTCGVDDATAKKIVSLLNRILKNEGGSASIDQKLDQLIEFVQTHTSSPYDPVVLYSVDGSLKRMSTEGGGHQSVTAGGPAADAFKRMLDLEKRNDWKGLSALCENEKTAERGWATPFLFCSEAHIRLGNLNTADNELNTAKGIVHNSPDYAPTINSIDLMLMQAKQQHP